MTMESVVLPSHVDPSDAQGWLVAYEDHLLSVRGLSWNSRRVYIRFATKLISRIATNGTVDWQSLNAELVADFVLADTRELKGKGVSVVTTAVRSFLRFLVSRRIVRAGLELAIPRLRTYRHTGIPQHLNKKELKHLLNSADDGTAVGRRDFAILLLLSKFGLRGGEVAALELRDIDWTNGEILIRTSKTHLGRKLPLLKSVAEALLDYLRNGRPSTGNRRIFLQHARLFYAISASSIAKIVGCRIVKAGVRIKKTGSHILRHSVATELINNGASFKDIADLLGHRTIESTAIYAKVDLCTLAKIGLPWPGGELK
jgi:integrase/recombinase XerD